MALAGIGEGQFSLQLHHPARWLPFMDGFTAHPQQQWHRERGWMANPMLPEAIFPPTVAVIGTNERGLIGEILEQRLKLVIHPLEAGALAPPAFAS